MISLLMTATFASSVLQFLPIGEEVSSWTEVQRSLVEPVPMSALGQKQTYAAHNGMSAFALHMSAFNPKRHCAFEPAP